MRLIIKKISSIKTCLPSIGMMPSGDESLTTMDTSFTHFKQSVDIFSINVIQFLWRL